MVSYNILPGQIGEFQCHCTANVGENSSHVGILSLTATQAVKLSAEFRVFSRIFGHH